MEKTQDTARSAETLMDSSENIILISAEDASEKELILLDLSKQDKLNEIVLI